MSVVPACVHVCMCAFLVPTGVRRGHCPHLELDIHVAVRSHSYAAAIIVFQNTDSS